MGQAAEQITADLVALKMGLQPIYDKIMEVEGKIDQQIKFESAKLKDLQKNVLDIKKYTYVSKLSIGDISYPNIVSKDSKCLDYNSTSTILSFAIQIISNRFEILKASLGIKFDYFLKFVEMMNEGTKINLADIDTAIENWTHIKETSPDDIKFFMKQAKKGRNKDIKKKDMDFIKTGGYGKTIDKIISQLNQFKTEFIAYQNNVKNAPSLRGKNYPQLAKAYNELVKKYTVTIHESDFKYIDYLLYLFVTRRAETMKEALQLLDDERRNQRLVQAVEDSAKYIVANFERIIDNLGDRIVGAIQESTRQIVGAIGEMVKAQYATAAMICETIEGINLPAFRTPIDVRVVN